MIFSIIIPAYNAERYISRCIDSVYNQTFDSNEFEVIVVDDCSPDNLADKVVELQEKYTSLHLIRHRLNKRQGGARNTGLKVAKGDYIMFLDADDYWIYRNILSILYVYVKNREFDIVDSISHQDVSSKDFYELKNAVKPNPPVIYASSAYIASNKYSAYVCMGCYRKKMLDNNSLYFRENVFMEDGDWKIKTVYASTKIAVIDFPFYASESICRQLSKKYFIDNIICNIKILEFVQTVETSDVVLQYRYKRTKRNIFSYIKISRHYTISDSLDCLKILRKSQLMNYKLYSLSTADYIRMFLLKECPILVLLPVRYLTLIKQRVIRRWSPKR